MLWLLVMVRWQSCHLTITPLNVCVCVCVCVIKITYAERGAVEKEKWGSEAEKFLSFFLFLFFWCNQLPYNIFQKCFVFFQYEYLILLSWGEGWRLRFHIIKLKLSKVSFKFILLFFSYFYVMLIYRFPWFYMIFWHNVDTSI